MNAYKTDTPWEQPKQLTDSESPPLVLKTEICIVGGGIAGLATAYFLTKEGYQVAVIDDGEIGSGETGHTTAHLSNAVDDRYCQIERLHGSEGAQICATSHTRAIDAFETIIREEAIECAFQRLDGYLFLSREHEPKLLETEREAARRAGVPAERVEQLTIAGTNLGPALRFPRQAQIEPLRFLTGLAASILRRGGRIFTGVHVQTIEEHNDHSELIATDGKRIVARHVVVATNAPVNTLVRIHTKQAAYRTYAIAARIARGTVPRALYWDTGETQNDPDSTGYHYVRTHDLPETSSPGANPAEAQATEELLIIGGEDHRTGQADDAEARWRRLESWARARFPIGAVEHRWSGQVVEPVDGVAFIGHCPGHKNTYVITGDSGMGMTHGMIGGLLITDLIAGRENPWATLYDPGRVSLRSVGTFLSENLNTAAQYFDWLRGGDVRDAAQIPPGQGAILRQGLHLIAAFRDEQGTLRACSAVCTHLGGIVTWNSEAKSWDCPCHGSRFGPDGRVLNGPAIKGLAEVAIEEEKDTIPKTSVTLENAT